MMNPKDLDRIRFVTRHYGALQGLRGMVPIGLIGLMCGLDSTVSRNSSRAVDVPVLLLQVAALAAAMFLTFGTKSYYARRFGEVERQPANWPYPFSALSPAGAALRGDSFAAPRRQVMLAFALALAVPAGAYAAHPSPVLMARPFYLVYGLIFVCTWIWRGSRGCQVHYLLLGVLLLGLAAPGSHTGFLMPGLAKLESSLIVGGTCLILAGLLDHRLLVRTMGRLAAEPLASAAAPQQAGQR